MLGRAALHLGEERWVLPMIAQAMIDHPFAGRASTGTSVGADAGFRAKANHEFIRNGASQRQDLRCSLCFLSQDVEAAEL
jgi:hypothetical protein